MPGMEAIIKAINRQVPATAGLSSNVIQFYFKQCTTKRNYWILQFAQDRRRSVKTRRMNFSRLLLQRRSHAACRARNFRSWLNHIWGEGQIFCPEMYELYLLTLCAFYWAGLGKRTSILLYSLPRVSGISWSFSWSLWINEHLNIYFLLGHSLVNDARRLLIKKWEDMSP